MKQACALALAFLLAAGPAGAQTSACVRDATGALQCAMRSAPAGVSSVRRPASHRDLSAAALARARAQSEALREAADRQRSDSDAHLARQRETTCPGTAPSASQDANPRPCGY